MGSGDGQEGLSELPLLTAVLRGLRTEEPPRSGSAGVGVVARGVRVEGVPWAPKGPIPPRARGQGRPGAVGVRGPYNVVGPLVALVAPPLLLVVPAGRVQGDGGRA